MGRESTRKRTRKSARKQPVTTGQKKDEQQADLLLKVERLGKPKSSAIITLGGFLQRREANEVMRTVNSLQEEDFVKVIFDLADVKYANSSAIGVFVNCASTLKASGGQAVLLAMRPNIKKVFDTLGLAGLFEIASTKTEALQKVK